MLVAKDQAFHLEGKPELRNPPITLKQGQITELVLRNDDPSRVLHCFSISGLDVKTPSIDSSESLTVTVRPTKRGTLTYACLMHPPMAGELIVQWSVRSFPVGNESPRSRSMEAPGAGCEPSGGLPPHFRDTYKKRKITYASAPGRSRSLP